MPRLQALLAPGATILGVALLATTAFAQPATPPTPVNTPPQQNTQQQTADSLRSGARVTNPPSGQNIRIWVRRAFVEPRGYSLNADVSGTIESDPLEHYLRAGERRMEHCIDSAAHPRLELAPDLNGNTVVRARIVVSAREITTIEMSPTPLSPVVEQCIRAGFTQTRYHFPRSGRIIAVFYMRPRPAA